MISYHLCWNFKLYPMSCSVENARDRHQDITMRVWEEWEWERKHVCFNHLKKNKGRTGVIVQGVKMLAMKADNLGLIPRTHVIEGKNWLLQVTSDLPTSAVTWVHRCKEINVIKNEIVSFRNHKSNVKLEMMRIASEMRGAFSHLAALCCSSLVFPQGKC